MNNFYEEIKKILTSQEIAFKYLKFTIFLLITAISYNLFIVSIELVAGGSGGLGVLFYKLFDIDPSVVLFFISFIMLVLSYLFLDAEQVVATLFVTIVYPLLVNATSGIDQIFLLDTSDTLIITLFAAVVTGFCQGYIFKLGLNIGGFSIVAKIIYKYFRVSVTFVNTFINAVIVLAGGYFLGFSMVLYAILFLIICRGVSEKVLLGISKNKTFKIITRYPLEIEKFIFNNLGHDVTVYDAYGAYNKEKLRLIMAVVPTNEFDILKQYVKKIDKKAFIFITDTYEAMGQDVTLKKEKC